MSPTRQIIVYTLEYCPHCEELKGYLKKNNVFFSEHDLSTAESLTELRLNGIFVNEAPVIQKDCDFLTTDELFSGGKLNSECIANFVAGA
ncbi:MAG: glutaredoxin family protein [Methanoregula sp.]|nr:glutaredoxin family protein [Methanoregula sp.]